MSYQQFKLAQAYIETMGPFELLVNITSEKGDHHELIAIDLIDAKARLRDFCALNSISLSSLTIEPKKIPIRAGTMNAHQQRRSRKEVPSVHLRVLPARQVQEIAV